VTPPSAPGTGTPARGHSGLRLNVELGAGARAPIGVSELAEHEQLARVDGLRPIDPGDHHCRPRPPGADDVRQRRAATLNDSGGDHERERLGAPAVPPTATKAGVSGRTSGALVGRPTEARVDGPSTLPLAFVRGATSVVVWRSLAAGVLGRSDPDASRRRGRSFGGAGLWCRLGPVRESPCVERPARQLRGPCAFDRCCDPAGPLAFGPGRPRPSSAGRAETDLCCRRDHDEARGWFTRMGLAVVAIRLERAG
jgi:hypothetical protein